MVKRDQLKHYEYIHFYLKTDLLLFEKYDFCFREEFVDFHNYLFKKTTSVLKAQLGYDLLGKLKGNINA